MMTTILEAALRSLVGRLEDAYAEVAYTRGRLIGDPSVHAGTALVALGRAVDGLTEVAYRFQCHERPGR